MKTTIVILPMILIYLSTVLCGCTGIILSWVGAWLESFANDLHELNNLLDGWVKKE